MRLTNFFYLSVALVINTLILQAQVQTIGLQKSSALATEGYTLFTPQNNNSVFLIDNCGQKIHEWTFSEQPALTCYFLENGNLLRSGKDSIEIRDWDNNQLWSFAATANGFLQHHDIQPLPNGNVLLLCTDTYTPAQSIAAGRQPAFSPADVRFERIVEIQPVGLNGWNLVWEWKFFDHLIQDFDSSKANYGVVENHPELLDVNFQTTNLTDWLHVNSVTHDPNLDHIMLSVRHINEIMIIDHSTTIAEAAGHTGGTANKGGDFLWRWGNPQVYRKGTATDQTLFLQHDAKFIPASHADSGKISVFNNGSQPNRGYSSLDIIKPIFSNNTYASSNGKFLPDTAEFSWNAVVFNDTVFELNRSGFQVQPNGNLLFCRSSNGQVSEFSRTLDHLWTYRNPTGTNGLIFNQFVTNFGSDNTMFRAEKYPIDYPGFSGKNLSPQGIIENQNTESSDCISLSIGPLENEDKLVIENPIVQNKLNFITDQAFEKLEIFDLNGKMVVQEINFLGTEYSVNIEHGTYILRWISNTKIGQQKIVIL